MKTRNNFSAMRLIRTPLLVGAVVGAASFFALRTDSNHRIRAQTGTTRQAQQTLNAKREWARQRLLDIDNGLIMCAQNRPLVECSIGAEAQRDAVKKVVASVESHTNLEVRILDRMKSVGVIFGYMATGLAAVVGFVLTIKTQKLFRKDHVPPTGEFGRSSG